MRKIRKRVFAAVLAAVLLFTMPGATSYAEAGGQIDEISESVLGLEETDGGIKAETGDGDIEEGQEPGNPEKNLEEEGKNLENPEENPEGEGKGSENPEEIPEEDEEEIDGEDSALTESVSPKKAARIGAQSEQTEASIASVTVDGVTSYYEHIDYLRIAWKEAQGKTAVIRILRDVDLGRYELMIDNADSNFILEMSEGVTLSGDGGSSGKRGFMLVYAGSLTMKSGTLHNTMSLQGHGVDIKGGTFILEGGTVKTGGGDKWDRAIHAENGSTVLIKGGEIIADKYGLEASNSRIVIGGGKITSREGDAIILTNCTEAEITGGEFTGKNRGIFLYAGSVKISGGTFSGNSGAGSQDKASVFLLTGGKFIGTYESLGGANTKPVTWLAEGYCYYESESGHIVPSASLKDYHVKDYLSVTVGECNHSSWQDWTNDEEDNHSHVCQGCGKTESGPHQWDGDGKCTVCEQRAAATVTVAGETKYYSLLSNAWKAVQGKTATVKIIQNVNLEEDTLEMNDPNSNITLEMAEGVILERPKNTGCLIHITEGNFTFASGTAEINYQGYADMKDASVILVDGGNVRLEGGMLTNTSKLFSFYGCGIKMNGGSLGVSGGKIEFPNGLSVGIQVDGGETVIRGGSIAAASQGVKVMGGKLTVEGEAKLQGTSGYGLFDTKGVSVLYGGIFTGNSGAIYGSSAGNVKKMPGEGCVYYNLDDAGNKTPVTSFSGTLKGTVMVAPCEHAYGECASDGNGSHTHRCKICGIEETEACDYEYKGASVIGTTDEDGHVGICIFCGHQKTQQAEPHTFAPWSSSSDTENGYARTCTACGWQHTAEIVQSSAMLQAVYGAIGEQTLSVTVTGAEAACEWKLQGADEVLGTTERYTIPTDLSVGNYTYQCAVTLEGDSEPVVILSYSLSVAQASLEEASAEMTGGEEFFYDGVKKEPDVSVKLGGKTLERDVDYIVSYADNVKAGTAALTITGIGNYTGTISKNFAIRYYETSAAAEGPTDWCSRAQITAPEGFAISDSLEGEFGEFFYYGTETGVDGAEIPYYLKQDETGYITDVKTIRVKVDTTQPLLDGTGNGIKITDRDAWWQELLSKITFGYYKTQVVTVQAADSLSGIDRIYYYVDRTQRDTPLTAEELRETGSDQWKSSDSVAFTLNEEDGYVIYAYAVDKVGNQSAYICSDGIVIDNTPPTAALVKPMDGGIKDTGAAPLVRMNEAGNITYILLDAADSGITSEKILNAADKGTVSITAEQAGKETELYLSGLKANSTYYLYAVGTDAAGNIGDDVAFLSFATLKSAIAGTVSLTGKATFGETLTASVNIETKDYGKVSYQWHRIDGNGNDVEIAGEESESYTLTADDIGKHISVQVTAAGYTGVLTARTKEIVQKAKGKEIPGTVAGSYTIEEQDYVYTVDAIAGAEYRMDKGPWQKSNVFTDIRPGSSHIFEARMAETDCYGPGDSKGTGQVVFPEKQDGGNSGDEGQDDKPDAGIPFIKGEDGKIGWDVIRAEEEKAEEGSTINVDMNGTTVVPGDIFDSIKGRDIIITFDMGEGTLWSVDGKSVTADRTNDIDFSVKTGTNAIPVDIVNNVTGERYSIQISLAYEGEFGLTAVLSVNLGKGNGGLTARLYYHNQGTGNLEFVCADTVTEDGKAAFAFTHASDYVIVVGERVSDENTPSETPPAAVPEPNGGDSGKPVSPVSPKTGEAEKTGETGHAAKALALTAFIGVVMLAIGRKKKHLSDS